MVIATILFAAMPQQSALADEAAPKTKATAPTTTQPVPWGGLGWGIGIATDFDVTGGRVGSASVVNNIVRVNDVSNNAGVSFVLEAHYFLKDTPGSNCTPKQTDPINCNYLANGPFVAIEVGDGSTSTPAANGPITAYALGWMIGMRHSLQSTSSWNIGLGVRVTPKGQVLGDGILANQPLPVGESTTVRLKTEPRVGIMLMSSFSFN